MRIFGGDKLFGRRKFTIALLIVLLSSLMLAIGKLDSGGYVTLNIGVMGLYGLASVGNQKAKSGNGGT